MADRTQRATIAKAELAKSADFNTTAGALKTELASATTPAQKAEVQAKLTKAIRDADTAFITGARSSSPAEYAALLAETQDKYNAASNAQQTAQGNLVELNVRPWKYPASVHQAVADTLAQAAIDIPRYKALLDQLNASGGPR